MSWAFDTFASYYKCLIKHKKTLSMVHMCLQCLCLVCGGRNGNCRDKSLVYKIIFF